MNRPPARNPPEAEASAALTAAIANLQYGIRHIKSHRLEQIKLTMDDLSRTCESCKTAIDEEVWRLKDEAIEFAADGEEPITDGE